MTFNEAIKIINFSVSILLSYPLLSVALFALFTFLIKRMFNGSRKRIKSNRNYRKGTESKHSDNIKSSYALLNRIASHVRDGNSGLAIHELKKVDAYLFEESVLSAFSKGGAKIYRSKRYSNDGGVDGKFKFNRNMYWVQSKRYAGHISNVHIKKHAELCLSNGAVPVFVHTGKTGRLSRLIAAKNGVKIVSGNRLLKTITGDLSLIDLLE